MGPAVTKEVEVPAMNKAAAPANYVELWIFRLNASTNELQLVDRAKRMFQISE